MIYLDYSATTPVDDEVLLRYVHVEKHAFANANSKHSLGMRAQAEIRDATEKIAELLKVDSNEIIYTSCASEANNTAIKGVALKYPNKKHIITSALEHSSVVAPLYYLQQNDYIIDMVNLDEYGRFDLNHLESLIKEDTLLICLVAVDSETGIRQPIEEVGKLAKRKNVLFHCDITQALGKCPVDLSDIDLISCSAHKIYGPKGIGLLIKRKGVSLIPLIHGGRSTTSFRSGTPQNALICAFAQAMELAFWNMEIRIQRVKELKTFLVKNLSLFDKISINSNEFAIEQILNFSVQGIDSDEWVSKFSLKDICISARSACSGKENFSKSVYAITKDNGRATSSLRISLSHLTTMDQLRAFLEVLEDFLKEKGE
jgi:cysteine desulfurase